MRGAKGAIAMVMLAALLSACSPQSLPFAEESGSPRLGDEVFVAGDGERLALKRWLPQDMPPKAVILALHGFNDYHHAFALPGEFLAGQGVAVIAYDQRGFGQSTQRGIWPDARNLTRDLRQMLPLVARKYPDSPLYLMGESMGGAVLINACAQGGCAEADGLILVAPALWGEGAMNGIYRLALWLAAHVIPASEWTGEDLDVQASDNLEILYAMGADPKVIKKTRVDSVYGLVDLMRNASRQIPHIAMPTLLLYGKRDEIIPHPSIADAEARMNAPHIVGYYRNGYHMLLRDHQRAHVLNDILSWIENPYLPLPSGADMGWKEELLLGGED